MEMPFASNETFRQIFQSSVEAIIMVNADGRILLANPVSEKMFRYEKDGLLGILVEELLPSELRSRHVEYRKTFNAHPEPRPMGMGRDLVAKRKDGTEFPVSVSLSYSHVDGQLLVMAFISDVTERKKAEEAVKRSEEQLLVYASELEKKVRARTEDLNSTIREMEKEVVVRKKAEEEARKALERERELNELKSKFVSIASHEFRTPLSTVLSSASLINQYKERGEYDKIDKHVNRIRTSVNHLTSILNDFLSLGKLEEGKVSIAREQLNVNDFLTEIRDEMKLVLKEGQRIEINAAAGTISTDARILRNILFNLISNSSKYSDGGKTIYLNATRENGKIAFSVVDEGIGIPVEEQKHMFERFFRATNAINIQGSGLGLNIVKRYLDLLDGSIDFKSEYGKGTVFKIVIPAD
jgi:PAS domain S-box-containing protein